MNLPRLGNQHVGATLISNMKTGQIATEMHHYTMDKASSTVSASTISHNEVILAMTRNRILVM